MGRKTIRVLVVVNNPWDVEMVRRGAPRTPPQESPGMPVLACQRRSSVRDQKRLDLIVTRAEETAFGRRSHLVHVGTFCCVQEDGHEVLAADVA